MRHFIEHEHETLQPGKKHTITQDVVDADGNWHTCYVEYREQVWDTPEQMTYVHETAVNALARAVARLKQPTTLAPLGWEYRTEKEDNDDPAK